MKRTICIYCEEPVLPGEVAEKVLVFGKGEAKVHIERSARQVVGSVGHQMGLCSCNGGPGKMDDPPTLTRRQAAKLALTYFNTAQKRTQGPSEA